jgi:hypothetical protein
LTGESVDTLNEQNMAMAADGVFQSQLAKMNADDAQTLSLGISQLPGPLQQLAKEFVGLGAPISETSRELQAMSQGAFGDAIKVFQNTGDIVAFQNSIKSISAGVMQSGEAFGDAALAGGGFGEALNAVAAAIGNVVDPEIVEREKAARGDNIVELVALRTETDRLKSAFETTRFELLRAFIYDENSLINVGEGLGNQFEKLTTIMKERLTPAIQGFGKAIKGEDVKEPIKFKDSAASMFSSPDGGSIISDFAASEMNLDFNKGTNGFRNFGEGTPAMLHGVEAVVPKNDIGQLANLLAEVGATTTNTNTTAGDTITNNTTNLDMTTLNANTTELIDLNKKVAQHLNTLVMIGSMTEKNTKDTKNNLANMGGSLV